MLGRLVTNWADIVGPELAGKTQPVKIRYIKSKQAGKKSTASLDIAAPTSEATVLHYQKDLILQRVNQIFGGDWVTAIRFVPLAANSALGEAKAPKPRKPLTADEKQHLSTMLENVEDPDLMEKLKNLGKAILQDKSS